MSSAAHLLLRRFLVCLSVLATLSACLGHAQRSFTLSLAPTNENAVAISWQAQSATPIGDLIIVPAFQLERSPDLRTWEPIGEQFSPTLGQILTLTEPSSSLAFYRVSSV